MSADRFDRLIAEAAGLQLDESPPFAVRSPSDPDASPYASAVAAREVGVGGGGTRFPGTVLSSKSFSVLSVRGSDRSFYCMGVMSKTGELGFCIRKNCSTKSHKLKKFGLLDEYEAYVFIVRVPGYNVFAEPCVKESVVPTRILGEWRSMSATLPNWVKAFRSVAITEAAEVPLDDADFKETKFLDDVTTFRTPFKKRKRLFQETGAMTRGLTKGNQ